MADPDDVSELTSSQRRPRRTASAVASMELTDAEGVPHHTGSAFRSQRFKLGLALGGFAAAAVLGGGAVVYLGRSDTFAVRVRSIPPGVEVHLDGAPTGQHTPATLARLSIDHPHKVELVGPGLRPWVKQVEPVRGETVELEATLDPAALGPGGTTASPDDRAARDEVQAPGFTAPSSDKPNSELRLEAAAVALSIPASRAARTRLDPSRTYKLTVEGSAALDDVAHTRGCFYFVERVRGASGAAFGWLGPKDTVGVSNARALYGFVVDPTPQDNAGALTLVAQEAKGVVRLPVDARENAIFPEAARGARFGNLGQRGRVQLELQGRADFGAGAGPEEQAIYWYDGTVDLKELARNPDVTHGVVRAGAPLVMQSPTQLVLFVPDDDTGDNSGALAASVHPLK
jgi:hypothetical protein